MVSDFACVDQGMSELFFQGLDAPEATAVNSLLGDFAKNRSTGFSHAALVGVK